MALVFFVPAQDRQTVVVMSMSGIERQARRKLPRLFGQSALTESHLLKLDIRLVLPLFPFFSQPEISTTVWIVYHMKTRYVL